MKGFELVELTLRVAFRNLWLYRFKTVIIGVLLASGSFLAVLGLSLLTDIEGAMQRSVTESVSGHIQIYSNKAKDELTLFTDGQGGTDFGTIADFAPLATDVMKNPKVKAFVPMGGGMALLSRGNEMDDAIDALRAALKGQDKSILDERIDQIRLQIEQLRHEFELRRKLSANSEEMQAYETAMQEAERPGFLESLKDGDESKLQFLETKVAPLSGEKQPIYLAYTGTDIESYQKNFSKFVVREGTALQPGERGILISMKMREDFLKNFAARYLDQLNKRIHQARIPIAGDPENERIATQLPGQYAQVVRFLDRREAEELSSGLAALGLGVAGGERDLMPRLTEQLKAFLTVNDENFKARYDWFYEHIAPKIRLYEINPGETLAVRSYTKSGYIKTVPVKVVGVYSFEGLEDSDLAGMVNIMDLVSFRELYGMMSPESKRELEEMRAAMGIREIAAADAEEALFGEGSSEATTASAPTPTEAPRSGAMQTIQVERALSDEFDPVESQRGLITNAAVVLHDPGDVDEVVSELTQSLKDAGHEVRVVDWQKASGIVGQLVSIARMVLIFAIVVIFVVALVIINNSIIVGTLNRIREIGTMRAIGAQRSFVMSLFLAETAITGLLGALLGGLLAAGVLFLLHKQGIVAPNAIIAFFFSGPVLYPRMHGSLIVLGPMVMAIIATLASLYAARYAAQVKPAEAMQEKE